MRKLILMMGLFALSCLSLNAQNVEVSATLSGQFATYGTLGEAFAAINAGTHKGAVVITIVGDCFESGSAILKNGATFPASYSSVRIVPSGERVIQSSLFGVLIDLQNADNVTIDGGSGENSLTLRNQAASAGANVGTVRFQGGASNNTLTRCTVLGSVAAANNTSATIICGEGANQNNMVSECKIGPSGSNLPAQAILCFSTTGSNLNFKVQDNYIYDFFATTGSSFGINCGTGATQPVISNNRMYQTGIRNNGIFICFIQFLNSSGSATITGNTIGFSSEYGNGNAIYNSIASTVFRGIYIGAASTGSAITSRIEDNLISGITFTTTRTAATIPVFAAIDAGTFNSGSAPAKINRNVIGSLDGSSSINVTYVGASGSSALIPVAGIACRTSTINGEINDNQIGSITVGTSGPDIRYALHGINVSNSVLAITVSGNQVGGAASGTGLHNNIPSMGEVAGIYATSAALNISENTIQNLAGNSGSSFNCAGINLLTQNGSVVSGNTIRNINNTESGSVSQTTSGILLQSLVSNSAISSIGDNLVEGLSVTSSGTVRGIYLANSTGHVIAFNNRIHVGRLVDGSNVDNVTILGLYSANSFNELYHNTVLIDGTNSGDYASYAAYINSNVTLKNSILYNSRSTSGPSTFSTAIYGSSVNADYNDVWATGTGGVVGTVSGTNYTTLPEYQAAGYNLNGLSVDPLFTSTAGTADLHVNTPELNVGAPLFEAVATDFEGDTRSEVTPTIGSDEITCLAPSLNSTYLNACVGQSNGSINLTVSGFGPFTISWTGPNGFTAGSEDISGLAAGNYTVTVGSGACSATASYNIVSHSQASITPQPNQLLCAYFNTTAINFPAVNGVTYNWTNSNTSIGLAASGTGNIPSFQTENNTQVLQRAFITVTPVSNSGCSFKPMVFNLSVNPSPTMNSVGYQYVCAGSATAPATFTGNIPGGSYSWYSAHADINLPSAGTGSIPSFIAQSDVPATVSQGIIIVPTFGPCTGFPQVLYYSVTPSVTSIAYSRPGFCPSGSATPQRNGSAGGTYSATPAGLSINASTGALNLAASVPGLYTVTYTLPFASGCNGSASTQVTVIPQSTVAPAPNQVYCNGMITGPITFTGTAASYSWTNDNPGIGLAASGTGTIPSFTTVNAGPATQYAYVRVTPQGNGSGICPGKAMSFRIAVNFCPPITQAGGFGGDAATLRSSFSLGPNPANGYIRLQFSGQATARTIEVRDGAGRTVIAARSYTGNPATIQISTLLPGLYYAVVADGKTGTQTTLPFMKF